MDVTRMQFYKDCSKFLNSRQLRKMRHEMRKQIRGEMAKVKEILKPFIGRKLDDVTRQDVFMALKSEYFNSESRPFYKDVFGVGDD